MWVQFPGVRTMDIRCEVTTLINVSINIQEIITTCNTKEDVAIALERLLNEQLKDNINWKCPNFYAYYVEHVYNQLKI